MGNVSFTKPDLTNVEHLVIYAHGIGFNGHKHGIHIKSFVEDYKFSLKTYVYLTQANIGTISSFQTMKNTLDGIKSGGDRLYNEIKQVIIDNPTAIHITHISVIGSSMGGIYLRYIIEKLLNKLKNIIFHSFITLATPHLGISGFNVKLPNWIISRCRTGYDLQVIDVDNRNYFTILSLFDDKYINALSIFKNRISYSPIYCDEVVHFPSSAIKLYFPYEYPNKLTPITEPIYVKNYNEPLQHGKPAIIKDEIVNTIDNNIQEEQYYFVHTSDDIKETIIMMQKKLIELEWNIIHVNLDHRSLATLYPQYAGSNEIISHLINHLKVHE